MLKSHKSLVATNNGQGRYKTSPSSQKIHWTELFYNMVIIRKQSESCLVVLGSLRPYGLYVAHPASSSVHGILQARILSEWAVISFSRESSQPRDRTQVPCIAGRFFTIWATKGPLNMLNIKMLMHFHQQESVARPSLNLFFFFLILEIFLSWLSGYLPTEHLKSKLGKGAKK